MDASLLATKLRIPENHHGVVARSRLVQALEANVPRHRLTVVAAPAGYGKSTLLADWALSTGTQVAWLSLDRSDNDLERLLRYLLAAWAQVHPAVAQGPLGILLTAQSPPPDAVLAALLDTADRLPAHHTFVLDDYQWIQDSNIHANLAFLLDHMPPHLHLILGTRTDPPLPLARYRARAQLLEIGPQDLRFTLAETSEFLENTMDVALPAPEVQHWHEQLQGWAAGLQLAALSRRHDITTAPSGRQRFIADYLAADVLDGLSAETRAFLLRTSLLDRLSGSLCAMVSGIADAQAMLERLEREHVFLEALDGERLWFQYHPLFADFLKGELARRFSDEVVELHRRAGAWYAAHDLPEQAYEHALAGQDHGLVIQIAERHLMLKLYGGEYRVVRHWIEALPEAWRSGYPLFGLVQVGLLAFSGAFDEARRLIEEVEHGLLAEAGPLDRRQLGRVTAVRCALACTQNDLSSAEQYAMVALRDLSPEDYFFQGMMNGSLGDTYRLNGRWREATQHYLTGLEQSRHSPYRLISVPPLGALADLALRQGQLRQAADYWREALAVIQSPQSWGSLEIPVVGWVYIRLGEILYEWDQRAEAWDHLGRGLAWADAGGDVRAQIAGYLGAGRLKLTEGDLAGAESYLEQARPLVTQAQFADWTARLQRFQIECWLAQGQLETASAWVAATFFEVATEAAPDTEPVRLAAARALIVQGERAAVEQARTLLDPLLAAAQVEGRLGIAIEALALLALAHWRNGDGPAALVTLERALRQAEVHGYRRLFVDLGLPMARLLQEARSRQVLPQYVATLLADFEGEVGPVPARQASLPEPLTQREMEVLGLLAAGLTNREIAEKLVISSETVKRHGASIYGKLGVGNRTQAVSRARALGLLA